MRSFKVKINDKLINETTVVKAEDIKTMEVSFDKPKKLSYYGLGRAIFMVEFLGEKNEVIESYFITKDGTNAVETFLADVNTFYALPSDSNQSSEFVETDNILGGRGINYKLMYFGKYYNYKTIKFKVTLGFRDKVGYQKFGDYVPLVKAQTYTIDNTTLYTEGQKLKAEEQVAAEAKKAENDKKANEEEVKSKGKKVLKKVLGW